MDHKPLNIFYAEPDPDRWFRYDRYPRKLIRYIVRGKPRPGGVMMVALNLMKGLERLNVPFRFNDHRYIRRHPEEIACIIGKPHLLEMDLPNPIIFGAGIFSHPIEFPHLLERHPNIRKVLVPGEWMRQMFRSHYGDRVTAWPVGIDTVEWAPVTGAGPADDLLIYVKLRWHAEDGHEDLANEVISLLNSKGLSYRVITYGHYRPDRLKAELARCKAAIFLCEHETQGLAYQQILATGTPVLAYDTGGFWTDPYYYPDKVRFSPVSSVPYWDERCGMKFVSAADLRDRLPVFLSRLGEFRPRDYIMENLTLEICARRYLEIYRDIQQELI